MWLVLCLLIILFLFVFLYGPKRHPKKKKEQPPEFPFVDDKIESRISFLVRKEKGREMARKLEYNFGFPPSDIMVKMVMLAQEGKVPKTMAEKGIQVGPHPWGNLSYSSFRIFILWYDNFLAHNGIDRLKLLSWSDCKQARMYDQDESIARAASLGHPLLKSLPKQQPAEKMILYWEHSADQVHLKKGARID